MRGGIGLNRLGLGLDNRISSGGASYSAEYQAIYDQFSSKPVAADATAQDTFVTALVGAGVWSELDRLFILASHASGADSLLDWIHPTVGANTASLVNAPSFVAKQGYTGDGSTSYINTNYNPSTDGVNWEQGAGAWSSSLGFYSRTSTSFTNGKIDYGSNIGGSTYNFWLNSKCYFYLDNVLYNPVVPNTQGLFCGDLLYGAGSSADINIYRNGSDLGGVNGSPTATTGDFFELCQNNGGSPAQFGDKEHSLLYIGGSLGSAKQLALYNAFQTLMTYYGTQV